ncbi:hypothetical protein [Serratia sp. 1D1416]|uniref:hypothetical protein n=1 Tax=Serratia sp. 1D1416 TaxID=2447890 RepID=UPI001013CB99|nr:hypothetical protein [Serratia sp. 1D1416]
MFRTNQLISIIKSFSPYKPLPAQNKVSRVVNGISRWLFITSFTSFTLTMLIWFFNSFLNNKNRIKTEEFGTLESIALLLSILCLITGHLAIIIPAANELFNLKNWKKEEINNLIAEIDHDQEYAKNLMPYEIEELNHLSFWLNKKISRISKRISGFFGEKTAIISMVGLIYTHIKETGVIDKLLETNSITNRNYNYLDDITIYVLAFLLGLSLGAIFLKKIIGHYTYLLEIVELAVRLKSHKDAPIGKN